MSYETLQTADRFCARISELPIQRAAKRLIDAVGAGLGLVLLGPVFAAVALVILVVDGRPILFRQERVGSAGRRFTVSKFRTMLPDAEARQAELGARNEVRGPGFKITEDPRLTRTGRFLRRSSLDELPQLWNVLKGEMSLVGPRPPLPGEVAGETQGSPESPPNPGRFRVYDETLTARVQSDAPMGGRTGRRVKRRSRCAMEVVVSASSA